MELKIDKGIPVPIRGVSKNTGIVDVLRKLEVGDSFRVATKNVGLSFQASVYKYALRVGIRVTTRLEREGTDTYFRIWRTL